MMDAAGIDGGILTINAADPKPFADLAQQYPGRFRLSTVIDPMQGMEAVRTIERVVKDYDVRLIRMVPFLFNRPPNDKVCYPIYAKCIELDVAVSVNTGIPGPPMPAEPQRPLYLDEVCLFFPELVLIMAHGADPWWGEAIRLLLKYPNLYMMTSAYLPKYLPQELIQFMNTRGQDKVMFATDFPFLPFDRAIESAKALPFRPGVLQKYLRDNARACVQVGRLSRSPARSTRRARACTSGGYLLTPKLNCCSTRCIRRGNRSFLPAAVHLNAGRSSNRNR